MIRSIPVLTNGYAHYLHWRKGLPLDAGWERSFREQSSINAEGRPIPWFVYSFLSFLTPRIRKDMTVFEYGAGHSTLWWADRVHQVTSVESNPAWFARIKENLPTHVCLTHQVIEPTGQYAQAILSTPSLYDIIVIDGRDRIRCAHYAVQRLKPNGVILWDNTDFECDRPGMQALLHAGFEQLIFRGLGPINHFPWESSVFYRTPNCLGI